MSLDFNARVDWDHDDNFPPRSDGTLNLELHGMIWATMITGIGHITVENAREFSLRWRLWNDAVGPQFNMVKRDEDGAPTSSTIPLWCPPDRVAQAAGLHTNASRLTWSQFAKRLHEAALDPMFGKGRGQWELARDGEIVHS